VPFAPPNLLISLESLGSNPTLSATQSKLQRNSLALYREIRNIARISQYFVRKAEWREWTAQDRMASLCQSFSGGRLRSPVSGRARGESNAITNR
jgi:hypothetical protein